MESTGDIEVLAERICENAHDDRPRRLPLPHHSRLLACPWHLGIAVEVYRIKDEAGLP